MKDNIKYFKSCYIQSGEIMSIVKFNMRTIESTQIYDDGEEIKWKTINIKYYERIDRVKEITKSEYYKLRKQFLNK